MSKRPWPVTFIGLLFIAVGSIGFAYHSTKFNMQGPFDYDLAWVQFVRLLAIIGGVFLLRGANWARWLLLIWIVYHIGVSTSHSIPELIIHIIIFIGISYVLLRPEASHYFRRK